MLNLGFFLRFFENRAPGQKLSVRVLTSVAQIITTAHIATGNPARDAAISTHVPSLPHLFSPPP